MCDSNLLMKQVNVLALYPPPTCTSYIRLLQSVAGMANFASQLAPNGRNLRLFKISFSTFWLAEASQNVLELILKSLRFVSFGANLTQYECQI